MKVKSMSLVENLKQQVIEFEKQHRLINKNVDDDLIVKLYSQEIIKYAVFEPHPQYTYAGDEDFLIFSVLLKFANSCEKMFVCLTTDKHMKQLFVKKSLQKTIEFAAEIVFALEQHNYSLSDLLLANKFEKTDLFAGGLT